VTVTKLGNACQIEEKLKFLLNIFIAKIEFY